MNEFLNTRRHGNTFIKDLGKGQHKACSTKARRLYNTTTSRVSRVETFIHSSENLISILHKAHLHMHILGTHNRAEMPSTLTQISAAGAHHVR